MSARQRRVGFVFQHYALFKHMTAEQNIAFALNVQKKSKKEIADRVGHLIDLVKMRGYAAALPARSFPAASASAWPLPAPSRPSRPYCSWMSPLQPST